MEEDKSLRNLVMSFAGGTAIELESASLFIIRSSSSFPRFFKRFYGKEEVTTVFCSKSLMAGEHARKKKKRAPTTWRVEALEDDTDLWTGFESPLSSLDSWRF